MGHDQYDEHRLRELRATEHRELAQYALSIEERLRRWQDITITVKLSALAAAFTAGAVAGYWTSKLG